MRVSEIKECVPSGDRILPRTITFKKIFQQSPPGSLLAGDGSITQPPLGLGLLDAAEEAVWLPRVS